LITYDSGRDGANYALGLHEESGACFSSRTAECTHDSGVDKRNNEAGIQFGMSIVGSHGRRTKPWESSGWLIVGLFFDGDALLRQVVEQANWRVATGALDLGGACARSVQGNKEC